MHSWLSERRHRFRDLSHSWPIASHHRSDLPGFGRSEMLARGSTFERLAARSTASPSLGFNRLCRLRIRLRRADWIPARREASGSDHGDHLAERHRLRGRPERRPESDPAYCGRPSRSNVMHCASSSRRRPFVDTRRRSDLTAVLRSLLLDNFTYRPGADELHSTCPAITRATSRSTQLSRSIRHPQAAIPGRWGENDVRPAAGAEAFNRDIPDAVVRFFEPDIRLETHAKMRRNARLPTR